MDLGRGLFATLFDLLDDLGEVAGELLGGGKVHRDAVGDVEAERADGFVVGSTFRGLLAEEAVDTQVQEDLVVAEVGAEGVGVEGIDVGLVELYPDLTLPTPAPGIAIG